MDCPIPGARGTQQPTGLCTNGVLLLGEAMGDAERDESRGFVEYAPAGSVLERAIKRSGFTREQFGMWNVVPTQPPNNYLEGAPYEAEAIAWGLPLLREQIARWQPRVILAIGNVALKATTGLSGISIARGYPIASALGIPVIGTLHPAFLRRGKMGYMSVLMHDLKFAVALAATAFAHPAPRAVSFWSPVLWRSVTYPIPGALPSLSDPPVPMGYECYPTAASALDFLHQMEHDSSRLLAYDIETPRSHHTSEDETDELEDAHILSIQFSAAPDTGIFLPWREPFIDIARAILALPNPKVGANSWRFDDLRLAAAGCPVAGTRHDLRWAWKHFQPDLSGALQFIASFYAPECGPWKHQNSAHPQFYGIRDVDMTLRCL
jgi:uracil-DNA glycosylase family 4